MLEAMQGVGIFAAVAVPVSTAMWWLMSPERDLGHGYEAHTREFKAWDAALSPKEQPRLRSGTR